MALTLASSGQGGVFTVRAGSFGGRLQASVSPTVPPIDADAQAFFSRVTAAGGALSATEQTAVNTLVVSMKSAGIWSLMKAIYPMVGASAAACAQNLKSSSFTGAFNGGWTYASTGVTPNGTNAFMNTNFIPSLDLTNNNYHVSHYSRTQKNTGNETDLNVGQSGTQQMVGIAQYYQGIGKLFNAGDYPILEISDLAATNTLGLLVGTRTSQTLAKMFQNAIQFGPTITTTNSNNLPSAAMAVGSGYQSGFGAFQFSSKQCAFASIGDGLNDTQVSNLYSAVQAFQTTLSRQV